MALDYGQTDERESNAIVTLDARKALDAREALDTRVALEARVVLEARADFRQNIKCH